jgi:hypothetical protein
VKRPVRTRAALAIAILAGLWCLRVALWRPYGVEGNAPTDGYTRVAGAVHVHTSLSDGGGTPLDVVDAARKAGLTFVVITDHNNLDAKPHEGYRDGVLVIVGSELSTTAGHLLALGIPDPGFRFSGDASDGIADIRDLGGHAFAAHPTSTREDFRWSGWDLPGPWGIELLNGDSQWRAAGVPRLLRLAATYPFNAPYALAGSLTNPADALARWDTMLAVRPVAGLMGADAHQRAPLTRKIAIPFPSYSSVFRLARNHVLLDKPLSGDPAADSKAIVDALSRGRSYVGVDALAPAGGVSFIAESGARRGTMGDTMAPAADLKLTVGGQMPRGARVVILKDGRPLAEGRDTASTAAGVGPGVYRAETRLDGWDVPWVLTNPITVADPAASARREAAAAFPPDPPVPAGAETIDTFNERSSFAPACDSASTFRDPALDATGGADGSGAALLDFSLGEPTDGHPDVFCALVDGRSRNLTGRTGLVFGIKGDRPHRIWIQVRDENSASGDEGTEWWFASVKAGPDWRRVTVPFARLRSINPKTDGKLDLDKVRALVFVLDKGSVKPGAKGRIWIDDVGAY